LLRLFWDFFNVVNYFLSTVALTDGAAEFDFDVEDVDARPVPFRIHDDPDQPSWCVEDLFERVIFANRLLQSQATQRKSYV